jgi:peptidoglycan LD-endopeptidase LytH
MSWVPGFARSAVLALAVTVLAGLTGCGGSSAQPVGAATPEPNSSPTSALAGIAPASPAPSGPASASGTRHGKYTFPVVGGNASYARTHHDYPASDIMAPCGATVVSPVNGVVLEVNRVDTYDPTVNAGATRGGLSVSILGEDGARYYGSHFSTIVDTVEPGVALRAGQQIAKVGKTGDTSACHVHFGLSPVCQRTGDWWIRRGVIWPWPYLDAWRGGVAKSPINELMAWKADHGCPTKPLVNP